MNIETVTGLIVKNVFVIWGKGLISWKKKKKKKKTLYTVSGTPH